jgi:hypothetical protein
MYCGILGRESSIIPEHTPPMQPCGLLTSLPPYVRPLPPTIMAEDLGYLHKKGSLFIPVSRVRNAILRSYVEFVHPYMPILDLEGFLGAIADAGGSGRRISLLLIQAVLFAGSAFVDMHHLFAAGFSDRKAARRAFFHRTKVWRPNSTKYQQHTRLTDGDSCFTISNASLTESRSFSPSCS